MFHFFNYMRVIYDQQRSPSVHGPIDLHCMCALWKSLCLWWWYDYTRLSRINPTPQHGGVYRHRQCCNIERCPQGTQKTSKKALRMWGLAGSSQFHLQEMILMQLLGGHGQTLRCGGLLQEDFSPASERISLETLRLSEAVHSLVRWVYLLSRALHCQSWHAFQDATALKTTLLQNSPNIRVRICPIAWATYTNDPMIAWSKVSPSMG